MAGVSKEIPNYDISLKPMTKVVIQRCILMTTDPGDLVHRPHLRLRHHPPTSQSSGGVDGSLSTPPGSHLALARARIMGARYPYYLLADSREGQMKEAEVSVGALPRRVPTYGNVRHGFVYQRVPHITMRDIANNS